MTQIQCSTMLCYVPIFCSFSSRNGSSFPLLMSYKDLTMTFNFNDITHGIHLDTSNEKSHPCSAYKIHSRICLLTTYASFNLVNCSFCCRKSNALVSNRTVVKFLHFLQSSTICAISRNRNFVQILEYLVHPFYCTKTVFPLLLGYSKER